MQGGAGRCAGRQAAHRATNGACWPSTRGTPTSSSSCRRAERPALLAPAGRRGARPATARRDPAVAEGAGRERRRQGREARRARCASACARVLADPARRARQMDVLANARADIVKALGADASAERAALVAVFDAALLRLQSRRHAVARRPLRRADRARRSGAARTSRKTRWQPKLPRAAGQARCATTCARDDREITDGYERQAVITAAAYLLGRAGLWAESRCAAKAQPREEPFALLPDEPARRQRAASAATRRGAALVRAGVRQERRPGDAAAVGRELRRALVELAPQDAPRIEKAAVAALRRGGAGRAAPSTSAARARCSAWATSSSAWNADGEHGATLKRLQAKLDRRVLAHRRCGCATRHLRGSAGARAAPDDSLQNPLGCASASCAVCSRRTSTRMKASSNRWRVPAPSCSIVSGVNEIVVPAPRRSRRHCGAAGRGSARGRPSRPPTCRRPAAPRARRRETPRPRPAR